MFDNDDLDIQYFNIPDEETQNKIDNDLADEEYIKAFNDWFDSLSPQEQREYYDEWQADFYKNDEINLNYSDY